MALAAGAHPKVVSERRGHSTVSFGLDVYSNAIPALQEEAAEKIAGLVFRTQPALESDASRRGVRVAVDDLKHHLQRYGGYGYGHILRESQTNLNDAGLEQSDIDRILIDNPRRMLAG